MYLLWSVRNNGWQLQNFTYGSARGQAKTYTHKEALLACKPHYGGSSEFGLIPVALSDLEWIANESAKV